MNPRSHIGEIEKQKLSNNTDIETLRSNPETNIWTRDLSLILFFLWRDREGRC